MAYVIEKAEDQFVDAVSKPDGWVERDPGYAQLFQDNRRLQDEHVEPGARLKTPDWKLVARMPSTLMDVLKLMSPDGVHLDKPQFYAWLKRNRQYATYDAKFGRA